MDYIISLSRHLTYGQISHFLIFYLCYLSSLNTCLLSSPSLLPNSPPFLLFPVAFHSTPVSPTLSLPSCLSLFSCSVTSLIPSDLHGLRFNHLDDVHTDQLMRLEATTACA